MKGILKSRHKKGEQSGYVSYNIFENIAISKVERRN
jgi:hypothetical protein